MSETSQSNDEIEELSNFELVGEPIAEGGVALLSVIPIFGPYINAISTAALSAWQTQNLKRFISVVKRKCQNLDESKLDKSYIASDEFKAVTVQTVEAVIRSSSELRCNALANAYISCFTFPKSQVNNKQALIRVLAQLSDEEMTVLIFLHKNERKFFSENSDMTTPAVAVDDIASTLNWNPVDTLFVCQSLSQLGLVYDPLVGTWTHMSGDVHESEAFRITLFGSRAVTHALDH